MNSVGAIICLVLFPIPILALILAIIAKSQANRAEKEANQANDRLRSHVSAIKDLRNRVKLLESQSPIPGEAGTKAETESAAQPSTPPPKPETPKPPVPSEAKPPHSVPTDVISQYHSSTSCRRRS